MTRITVVISFFAFSVKFWSVKLYGRCCLGFFKKHTQITKITAVFKLFLSEEFGFRCGRFGNLFGVEGV